jgi:hypothetical protein
VPGRRSWVLRRAEAAQDGVQRTNTCMASSEMMRCRLDAVAAAALFLVCANGAMVQAVAVNPLPRLVVEGRWFRLDTGARWTGIEATDFNLLSRFIAGEDITPILRQRAAVGFNLLRVWTDFDACADGKCPQHQAIGRLVPSEHSDYYARLREFLDACAQHGLYVELTAFTGRSDSNASRLAHWEHLIAAVAPSTNVLLELINEHNVHHKPLPYDRLHQPPAPILASHGSGGAGAEPKLPIWSYVTYHPGFGQDWMRKAVGEGVQLGEEYNVPVLLNETTRFPDSDTSLEHAYDVGRGCALMQAGCAFHSVSGKNSRLWEGHELALAREWTRGARSVPLACQRGASRQLEDPHFLRAFERTGAGLECRADIRR